MSKITVPINVGGEPPRGEGGILGEAEIELTPGGIFFRMSVAGETLPTISFDRNQLHNVIVGAHFEDLFTSPEPGQ